VPSRSARSELALILALFVDLEEHRGDEHQESEPGAEQEDDLHHLRTMGRWGSACHGPIVHAGRGLFASLRIGHERYIC